MTEMNQDQVRAVVREQYGSIARGAESGCCGGGPCGTGPDMSRALGYTEEDLASVPEGANLGLGCGNPQAIAALQEGETVLDLGSGGGFDCFLAAKKVGASGKVLGVDMTADMVAKARANAVTLGSKNVEFRLGEIERLPVADNTVDVILSNCVINLSPDKAAVFADTFRVLKPGGRLAISDVVTIAPLPQSVQDDLAALTGCVSGAVSVAEVQQLLTEAGFKEVQITVKPESRAVVSQWMPGSGIEDYVASATLEATKSASACCSPTCCTSSKTAEEASE